MIIFGPSGLQTAQHVTAICVKMVVSAGPLTPITATSVNAVKGSLEDIVN